jgi:hypothetical protein
LPAASIDLTKNVWTPSARLVYVIGVVQELYPALSRLHSNVELLSVDLKLKLAAVLLEKPDGAAVIAVSGGVVSIVHV